MDLLAIENDSPTVVHVTTGGGGLDAGQVIVAIAAVLAALITVYTANKRHRQQLAHDRELRVEELAHDRDMRNREHIRDTVDSALEALTQATRSLAAFSGVLSVVEERRSKYEAVLVDEEADEDAKERARKLLGDLVTELEKPRDEAHAITMEMLANQIRLAVRLGEGHQVVTLADEVADCYRAFFNKLQAGVKKNRDEEERASEEKFFKETIDPKAQEFVRACEDWFRSS